MKLFLDPVNVRKSTIIIISSNKTSNAGIKQMIHLDDVKLFVYTFWTTHYVPLKLN